jgi:hypothetical protein
LAKVLKELAKETASHAQRARTIMAALREGSPARDELLHLERLQLDRPRGLKEKLLQKLVLRALRSHPES